MNETIEALLNVYAEHRPALRGLPESGQIAQRANLHAAVFAALEPHIEALHQEHATAKTFLQEAVSTYDAAVKDAA